MVTFLFPNNINLLGVIILKNNFDQNMINNLKDMMGEKQVDEALSQISPEMIENFSKMMNNNSNSSNNPNFSDIDMATLMKAKSIFNKMKNKKDDPRSNLLNSLKPYMRESRKENIDKYSNLLKMADILENLKDE